MLYSTTHPISQVRVFNVHIQSKLLLLLLLLLLFLRRYLRKGFRGESFLCYFKYNLSLEDVTTITTVSDNSEALVS